MPIRVEWLTVQARITVFHQGPTSADALNTWWDRAFTSPPLRTETRPQENVQLVSGATGHGQLTASARPGRVDFILDLNDDGPMESQSVWPVPATGNYRETAKSMADPVHKWLTDSPPAYRLAVGARLLAPGPEIVDVHSTLDGFLPNLNLRGLATPDFTLRVNRTRLSTNQPEVLINRLSTWSIAQGQNVAISPNRPPPQPLPVQYAAHLELDINTSLANGEEFSDGISGIILDELVDLAIEIAEKGDQP